MYKGLHLHAAGVAGAGGLAPYTYVHVGINIYPYQDKYFMKRSSCIDKDTALLLLPFSYYDRNSCIIVMAVCVGAGEAVVGAVEVVAL